jgi:negative regulator of sigma-B (phosphoserine phosphatase)
MVSALSEACVEWAAARAVAPGHRDSGDEFCIRLFEHRTMIAVLDGLGHGPAAATVAKEGLRLLEQAQSPDVVRLVHECHEGLRGSRGVVMSLAMVDSHENTMTWIGVGNVCGTLHCARSSARKTLLLRGGLIGNALPRLQASVVPVVEGDMLIFTTDGVNPGIEDRLLHGQSLQAIAERILARNRSGRDDALALVARYRGAAR